MLGSLALVVGCGQPRDRGEGARRGKQALGDQRVRAHLVPLADVERPGLVPDRVGDADAAQIVQPARKPGRVETGGGKAQRLRRIGSSNAPSLPEHPSAELSNAHARGRWVRPEPAAASTAARAGMGGHLRRRRGSDAGAGGTGSPRFCGRRRVGTRPGREQ
jgi:hypothetical protein